MTIAAVVILLIVGAAWLIFGALIRGVRHLDDHER